MHYFYGKPVLRFREAEKIRELVGKYRDQPVTEELKQKVWDELMMEKHKGHITIPFKLVVVKDPNGKFPSRIDVILDTKL